MIPILAFHFGRVYGCGSLLVLVIDIFCIIQIAESRRGTFSKTVWILLVILFPFLGALAWTVLGKK